MRKLILAAAGTLLLASSAIAADHYKFHLKITDPQTGLRATPDLAMSVMPAAKLVAEDQVIVLDGTTGTHWKWLMLSWPEKGKKAEQGINDRGSGQKDADIVFAPGTDALVKVRCLRDECQITTTVADAPPATTVTLSTFTLKRGESKDLPPDADVDITFVNYK
jgi:hypothetical protein